MKRIRIITSILMVILTLLVMTGCSRGPEGNELPSKQLAGDGLIALKKDGKWGYLNTKGQEVIPFEYDNAGIFQHGLSVVLIGEEHFVLNTRGQRVIDGPSEFLKIDSETGLIWFVEEGKVGLKDQRGRVLSEAVYHVNRVMQFYFTPNFSDGLAKVEKEGLFGYINTKGELVIPTALEKAEDFFNGYAAFSEDGKYGYIDKQGNVLIEAKYLEALPFDLHGLAAVGYQSGLQLRYKVINTKDETIVAGFTYISTGYGYILGRGTSNNADVFDLYNKAGEFIHRFSPPRTHITVDMQLVYKHVLLIANTNQGQLIVELYDYDGELSFPIEMQAFGGIFYDENHRLTVVGTYNDKLRLVNRNEVIDIEMVIQTFRGYSQKLIAVGLTDRAGVVDIWGRTVVDFNYRDARIFEGGFTVVELFDKYGVYDRKGNLIIPIEYDDYRSK